MGFGLKNTYSRIKYDELNRLIQADGSGYGSKLYQYDEIGNILSKDGKSYFYGSGITYGAGPQLFRGHITYIVDITILLDDNLAHGNLVWVC